MKPSAWTKIIKALVEFKARYYGVPVMDEIDPSEIAQIEVWRGVKKVTIYPDTVLRSWGTNMDTEMSDEPKTFQSVQSAFDWLYSSD